MSTTNISIGEVSSGLTVSSYDTLIVSGGTAVDTIVSSAGNVSVYLADGKVVGTVLSGGSLYASGGTAQSTTIESGGVFSALGNSFVAQDTTVNSGGKVDFRGRELVRTTVNTYGRVDVYGGTVTDMTLNTSGSAYFYNGGTVVNDLIINGAESYQYTQAFASNGVIVNGATAAGSYAYLTASNANVNNVQLDGGVLRMSGSATATDVAINEGGSMSMEGSATATGVSVNQGGWFSAGFNWYGYYGDLSAIGATVVENGGAVYVGSGNVSNYIEDETGYGYYVSSTEFFPVTFQSNVFSNLVYSTGRVGTVHSGTSAEDITAISGGLTVFDGGVVNGYTVTPVTYDKPFERLEYSSSYNAETDDWEYTSEFVTGIETVTDLGNLTVVAGGTVTGLVAEAMPGDEYSWESYLNFEIAPNTLITGTIDGQSFMVQNGDMRPGSLKNANLTYMGGIIASGVSQINGIATFKEGVFASDMVFSGTSVTFNRGATVEFVRTAPVPYVYTEYEGGFGPQDEEPEETIVSSFMGAHVDVYAGAHVSAIHMTDKDYLHMQVAPNTVLTGTSGGVALNMTDGVFTSASLGSTYVEVMGSTTSNDETTAGTTVTIAGGTVTDLIVNPGACVSAAEGATALNLTENGGAVLLGWGNEIPATITYSINSNTFSYDHLVGGDNPITVHKNTVALDNIMFGGELQVFSGGVVSNFYTVGSGMNMNMISLYEGAIVTNIDTVRYSDPGKYHPGQIEFNKNVTANVARLTDYDGITLFVGPDSVLTNGSIDNVPFSIENGVLSGFMGSDESWFGDTIGIYRGAGMIDCRTDQWANVNIWQGGYGYNNTFADGYVYVGDTAYDDESEEGGIALLEKSTLGVAGNRDKGTTLYVRQNGVVRDITVNSGSGIEVGNNGKLTGKIRKSGATISVDYGGVIDFDITAQDALTEARVDSLWNVTNDGRYSITIDGTNQAAGTYVLADATYFNDIFFYDDNAVIYFDLMDVSGSTFGYFYMAEENQYHYDEETGDEWYESVVAINYVATSRELQPAFGFSLTEGRRDVGDGGYNTTLLFTVDSNNVAPEWVVAPTVTADLNTFTPSDVTLTAVFSDDTATKEYSLDGQIWTAFPTGGTTALTGEDGTPTRGGLRAVIPADEEEEEPVVITGTTLTVTANGTYYFRGISVDGVVSDVTSYRVSNIDKVAPSTPTDLGAVATEDGVRLSWAEASDDYSGIRKYIVSYREVGAQDFITVETPYKYFDIPAPVQTNVTAGVTVIADDGGTVIVPEGTVVTTVTADPSDYEWSVQAVDYAGNVSEVATFDNGSALAAPVASADVTTLTNGDVTVTATFAEDAAVNQYSLNGGLDWFDYTEGIVFRENNAVYFRSADAAGNFSAITVYTVDNIDKVAPEAPIADASTYEPTNQDVIVTATFSNDAAIREASVDGENWVEYPANGMFLSENGTVYFRGTDAAGNVSDVTNFLVNNIDKVAPNAPVASMTAADTFDGVLVSAVFSDDTVIEECSLDGEKWLPFTDTIPVSEIGTTVFFRGIDAAGNVSEITSFTVTSFNVGADLDAPVARASTTEMTSSDVYVIASFDVDAAVNQYSFDGLTWEVYNENVSHIPFEENGVVYFRSLDETGAASAVTTYEVKNIDKVPPSAPFAYASTTEPTNQNVTVYARFDDDAVVRSYSIVSTGRWFSYTDEGVVLTENDTVLFAAEDAAGNYSEMTTFVVSNIDKIPPKAPVASMTTAEAFEGVLVSAVFSEDSVTQEYSLDGRTWQAYQDAVPVDAVGMVVYFRGTDAVGNVSDVTECKVESFILGPAAPVASADITAPTNQNVTVTATFDAAAALNQYSFNTMDWFTYDGSIVLEDNDVVYFRSFDAEGRSSSITTVTVDNIDKEGPNSPYAYASTTDWTNQDVTVFARFSEDSVVRQYRLISHGEEWFDYPDSTGVVLSENDSVVFRGIDAAGNESNVLTLFSVTNIDKVAPTAPTVSASAAVLPAGKGVDVTATFSDDSVKQEYSLDGRTWNQYNGPVLFTELGTAYFRGTDAAGNVSDVTKYEVTKLSLGPAAPFAFADITAPTNQDVTVYATFDDSAVVRRYAIDSLSSWYDYTDAGVVVSKNSKVYFACTNADGEGSDMTTFTVSNIDKTPPRKPTVSASATEDTFDPVTVTAVFSDDSVQRQYSYDRQSWYEYSDEGITLETNGSIYFRGLDAVGNISEVTRYVVDNIGEPVEQDGYADNGWNDWIVNIEDFNESLHTAVISPYFDYNDEILFDKNLSIDVDGWHNFVGKDETGAFDKIDYVRVQVDENMRLSYDITASGKVSCVLWAVSETVDKTGEVKKLATAVDGGNAKKDKTTGLFSYHGNIQVEGEMYHGTQYYLGVLPPTTNKKDGFFYNAEFDRMETEFYRYCNNDDDGGPELGDYNVVDIGKDLYVDGWVGFGDEVDFYGFSLEHSAKLGFGVTAGTYLAFDLYEYTTKNGKQTLNKKGKTLSIKSELVEMPESRSTGYITLDPGDYYFSVKSTNVQKCGEEEINYIIRLMPESVFYMDSDNGWNNWVTRPVSRTKSELNTEVTDAEETFLYGLVDGIQFDREGDVAKDYTYFDPSIGTNESDTYTNYVGVGDPIDFKKVSLGVAANLSFSVHASDASVFTLYKLERNKRGVYSLKALQTTNVKYDKTAGEYQAKTKRIVLDAGDYYISMQAGKTAEAFYNVNVYSNDDDFGNSTVFFFESEGGNVDDWTDVKTKGASSDLIGDVVELTQDFPWIGSGWVGYGDPIDYAGFTIDGPAKLVFDVAASDKAKFTVYTLQKKKLGYTLKPVMEATLKENKLAETSDEKYTAETKALLLTTPGTYYVSMQSANASKGGNAYYNISVNADKSAFFDNVKMNDSGNDNWKALSATAEKQHVISQKGEVLEGWVGYGDAVDYYGFSLKNNTNVVFSVTATDEAKFTLSAYTERRGKVSLKVVQKKTALKYNDETGLYEFTMSKKLLSKDTLYYITMESTNAKKGGSADYTVAVETFQPSLADALSMPETSDALASSDDLSLGQFAETSSAISSAVTDALDDKLGSFMNASWTTLA